jgi:drug/metabolite transporter (DMT)-like permease
MKIKEKVQNFAVRSKQAVRSVTMSLMLAAMMMPTTVMASSTSYLEPINKLKTVFIAIIAAAGVIVLGYGGLKFGESFQKKDQNGEYNAIYTIIAGAVMVGIDAIIVALT